MSERLIKSCSKPVMNNREDFRNDDVFSIDPIGCMDIDDAMHIKHLDEGQCELGIHIADVSSRISSKSEIGECASQRMFSVYCNDNDIPFQLNMLPDCLSTAEMSLVQGDDRPSVSVVFIFREGHITDFRITKSVIQNKKAMTYNEAQRMLDGIGNSKIANDIRDISKILSIYNSKSKLIEKTSDNLSSHEIVQMCMIMANWKVAERMREMGTSLVRFHLHTENTYPEVSVCDTLDNGTITAYKALQMNSARYAVIGKDNTIPEHSSIGLKIYTHFTSPIRRYFDILVHRILFEKSNHVIENLSEEIERINDAERRMKKFYRINQRLLKTSKLVSNGVLEVDAIIIGFRKQSPIRKVCVWIPSIELSDDVHIISSKIYDSIRVEYTQTHLNDMITVRSSDVGCNAEIKIKLFQKVKLKMASDQSNPNPKGKLKIMFSNPDFMSLVI